MPEDVRGRLELLPGVHLVFLLEEGKAEGGSFGETQNQACRGGAAVVRCHRLLLDLLGWEDVVGADDRALVFTTTYTDGLPDFHVHWAEVTQADDALPIYNMSLVKSRSIMDLAQFRNARVTLHDLLDWAARSGWMTWKHLYDSIVEYSKQESWRTQDPKRQKKQHP